MYFVQLYSLATITYVTAIHDVAVQFTLKLETLVKKQYASSSQTLSLITFSLTRL